MMGNRYFNTLDKIRVDHYFFVPDGVSVATANGILREWSNKNPYSDKIFKVMKVNGFDVIARIR